MFERMYSTRKLNSSLGLALALFCLCAVSCANIFQDKVAMSHSGSSASLGGLLVGKSEIKELAKPSYVNVSLYEFNNRIRITWESVKYATSYSVERAVVKEKTSGEWKVDESDYEPLEHSSYLQGTSYTDTIITGSADNLLDCDNDNYKYAFFYRVKAVNTTLGLESEYAESDEGRLLAPPSGTTADKGESETTITVTWDKTDGAVRYEIYRSLNEDGSNAVSLGTTLATQYVDTPPTAYAGEDLYYIVRSVGGYSGEKSVDGSVAFGYTLVKGAPKAVEKVEVVQGEGHGDKTDSIKIKWDDTQTDVDYTVYRTSSESATMKKLVEIKPGSPKEHLDTKDLKENIYYYYYVQTSKKETEGEGENAKETVLKGPMSKSGPNDTSPAEGFILSKPSSVEVVKNGKDSKYYTISFAPVIGDAKFATKGAKASYSNNYEYVVLKDGSQNGSFDGEEAGRKNSSALTYNEATGKYSMDISQDKFYKMKVMYNGAETGLTSVVAPSPYEAQNVYVTCAALVLDNGEDSSKYKPATDNSPTEPGSNANGVHKVKITWTAPEEGADYYEVYRSEKIGSGFKKISGDNPLPSSKLEYVDDNESAKVGQIYYYKVLSLNELKQGANYSEIDAPVLEGGIIKTTEGDGVRYGRGWGWGALTAWQYVHEMCKTVDRSHAKSKKLTTSSLTDKIGTEIINGDVTGVLDYNAQMDGIGGRAILQYKDYVDYYIGGDKTLGYYFMLNGYTNSTANASQNGTMDGTVTCQGMYRGSVKYDAIEVKGGDSGGGYYILRRTGIDDSDVNVSFLAGKK